MIPKPKFKAGDTVSYADDRRTRRLVIGRYWDPRYPSWRYRLALNGGHELRIRKDLARAWAVIEQALVLVK